MNQSKEIDFPKNPESLEFFSDFSLKNLKNGFPKATLTEKKCQDFQLKYSLKS